MFSFARRLVLGCSMARSGLFKLSFTRRETPLAIFCSRNRTTIIAKSGVVSRLTLLNRILNVQRQQWLLAALTVGADGKTNSPEFPRWVAFFIAIMVSPHRVLNTTVVILEVDLQILSEVQDGVVCVLDPEILIDHPCDLHSREKSCFFFVQLLLE